MATFETCVHWQRIPASPLGYCGWPAPLWIIQGLRDAGRFSPTAMPGDTVGCPTHQPREVQP